MEPHHRRQYPTHSITSLLLLCSVLFQQSPSSSSSSSSFSSSSSYYGSSNVIVTVVEAKIDRNLPHGHRGKLQPYPPGPFVGLTLTKEDEKTLDNGDSVMKQTIPSDGSSSTSTGGAAICVQDVQAPITAVWSQILHMEEYPKKVNKVLKCENYYIQPEEQEQVKNVVPVTKDYTILRIKTKQILGVLPGYSVSIPFFFTRSHSGSRYIHNGQKRT